MISHKIKNYTIGGLLLLFLISLSVNLYQKRLRKDDKFYAELAKAQSNTIIAQKQGEISIRDSLISTIRKERQITHSKDSVQLAGFKSRVVVLQAKLSNLPKTVPYSPDSATVDSLRVAFVLKDSVIDTQALMIMNLETEKQGLFASFTREVQQLTDNRNDQIVISNQLQTQLVSEQSKTRKQMRAKKFWRGFAMVATAGVAVLLLSPK